MSSILPAQSPLLVAEGNQWNTVNWPTFGPNTSSFRQKIGEDTLLDNTVYHKVYSSNKEFGSDWKFYGDYLRQDTLTNRVYYKDNKDDEVLLYDFNMGLNDTFAVSDYAGVFCQQTVTQIDTILLNNGEPRKRLKLANIDYPSDTHYWIEGLGSTFALIHYFVFCLEDIPLELLCFYANGELLYPPAPQSCFITSPKFHPRHRRLRYNPIRLRQPLRFNRKAFCSIVFALQSHRKRMTEGHINQENTPIDGTSLPSGAYLLSLTDEHGRQYSRWMVKI
ncbi:MAG: hypothetical protein IPJ06_04205 [Saprospiraceae bacterium]|nr:hypothetical protein [Saprospiraceae bacterium]